MKQIELTLGKYALIDDDDYAIVSRYKWRAARAEQGGTNPMNLKSIAKDSHGWPAHFAYLIEPTCPMRNDQELYAAVEANGRAVLRPFKGVGLELLPVVELTPAEFQQQWRGD